MDACTAKNAAKVLDKLKPKWAKEIDLERLNLMSSSDCLLGQLFGSYSVGLGKVFQATSQLNTRVFVDPFQQDSWELEIKKRLKKRRRRRGH